MANSRVKVATDSSFKQELNSAGNKLVIVDFTASWCGPCKRIAPVFASLSMKYPHVVFLKVDVDESPSTSAEYKVSAMPTFVFIRSKVKIDSVTGGDPNVLQEKVKSHAEASKVSDEDDVEVKGQGDLRPFFNVSGCNCLNESDENPHINAFDKNSKHLDSDCDEQLILTIAFTQAVKIHSLKIDAPSNGCGPKRIKLFTNQPNAVDFDQAERMEGLQAFELSQDDITGEKLIPLRFVKFQNVSNLVIFVQDNQGGEEVTSINYIKLVGSPLDSTNMNEFKRVAGKAGESH